MKGLSVYLEIIVRRETLLYDLIASLSAAVKDDLSSLRLPLKVSFVGEDAVDQGGLKSE